MTALAIGNVLAGTKPLKQFRTGQPVWRNSYYEGTIESRLYRPFAGGNKRAAKRLSGAMLKAARDLDRSTRRERQQLMPGARNGVLGQVALDVLDVMLNRFLDYRTGRLEPAIATISEAVGHSYSAVHNALKRLRQCGFLHWMRRSRPTDNKGGIGPQVEQIPNAYAILIPPAIKGLIQHIFAKAPIPADASWHQDKQAAEWEEMLATLSNVERLQTTWDGDPKVGEKLATIAALLDKQERESSSNGETGRDTYSMHLGRSTGLRRALV